MRDYTDSYVAFMDLLGFKSILKSRDFECEDIARIFDEITTQYYVEKNDHYYVEPGKIHFKVMSDSVCIYIDSSIENSLMALIFICTYFQIRLMRLPSPILVRGGISKGNMYSSGDVLFGQGLSDAYTLENDVAKYPRIIIPKNIVDDYYNTNKDSHSTQLLSGFLFEDFDEFYTINYPEFFTAWGYKPENGERIKKLIYDTLSDSRDPGIREKYLYLHSKITPKINKAKEQNNE